MIKYYKLATITKGNKWRTEGICGIIAELCKLNNGGGVILLNINVNKRKAVFLPAVLFLAFIMGFTALNWDNVRLLGTATVRDAVASYNRNIAYKGFNWITQDNIDVAFKDEDEALAQFILNLSIESFHVLQEKYMFTPNVRPLVVIYPNYEELLKSLGWDENNKVSGVYQGGTIKLVSPKTWYPVEVLSDIKEIYRNFGPLHHEMTHLFVDYIAKGNYPDWYTEGLAQLEELKFLDIQWIDENNQNPEKLYTFDELRRGFYRLDNQALAYRQSLTMAIFLEEVYGKEVHMTILKELGTGKNFSGALIAATGITMEQFEKMYLIWIEDNWNKYF